MKDFRVEIQDARSALTQVATADAILHLEAALESLQQLIGRLHQGYRPTLSEKRDLERGLLQARTELRQATRLAEQGLAFCKDWTAMLQPAQGYEPNGVFAVPASRRGDLSLDA